MDESNKDKGHDRSVSVTETWSSGRGTLSRGMDGTHALFGYAAPPHFELGWSARTIECIVHTDPEHAVSPPHFELG